MAKISLMCDGFAHGKRLVYTIHMRVSTHKNEMDCIGNVAEGERAPMNRVECLIKNSDKSDGQ
jgi:hypothetical protein